MRNHNPTPRKPGRQICLNWGHFLGMRDHRSLLAWQEARWVTGASIQLCRYHWKPYGSAVFDQLQRAAVSAQINIAEGYALAGAKRFHNHLVIAYGSAVEAGDLLRTGKEEDLFPEEISQPAIIHNQNAQSLLLGLLKRFRK